MDEPLISWDRQGIAAVCVAMLSILLTLRVTGDAETIFSQLFILLLPLSVIFWPEVLDRMYRNYDQRGHGGKPTPRFVLQVVAWIALLVLGYWHFTFPWLATGD